MCWCLGVYWTVVQNLFARLYNNLVDFYYNNNCYRYFGDCSCCREQRHKYCQYLCYCCCYQSEQAKHSTWRSNQNQVSNNNIEEQLVAERLYEHDYVIVDEIDANYIEIPRHKIETEQYYRTVNRAAAEELLSGREDGACVLRPFKEADISIKYIVSIYAQQQYFHLFIRQIGNKELYAIGQEKPNERHFKTPLEIIEFYSQNPLLCTNKQTSQCVVLKPIVA